MTGKLKDLYRLQGGEWLVSFTTRDDPSLVFDSLKDQPVKIDIKKEVGLRSRDANAFCWAMCTDIGNALCPPLPKEMVYRQAIREVGVYHPIPIRPDAVERFCERWSERGTGWFAEVVDDVWLKGKLYKLVFAYFGTSTYDVTEMSRVLEFLKADMENMGLQIPLSKEQEARVMARWGNRVKASCNKETHDATSAAG